MFFDYFQQNTFLYLYMEPSAEPNENPDYNVPEFNPADLELDEHTCIGQEFCICSNRWSSGKQILDTAYLLNSSGPPRCFPFSASK